MERVENFVPNQESFDWQGHRGCRGLMPENSIEGFIYALQFPIQTLELDVVLSKDEIVIVSHEPWFSDEICACEDLNQNNIFLLSYDVIQYIDCGSKPHPRFPEQAKIITYKPSLFDAVGAILDYCRKNNRNPPRFNIELKSHPDWDGMYHPEPALFVERVYQTIRSLGIEELTTIQSFDPRILNRFQSMNTKLRFAFLTESPEEPLEQMEALNRLPDIYSPNYKMLNAQMIHQLHQMNVLVIPWTVNDLDIMRNLIKMGVDGIITDYPNLIAKVR